MKFYSASSRVSAVISQKAQQATFKDSDATGVENMESRDRSVQTASHSNSSSVNTFPSWIRPFTLWMIEQLVSALNSTHTSVHWPWELAWLSVLVTWAGLIGYMQLVVTFNLHFQP